MSSFIRALIFDVIILYVAILYKSTEIAILGIMFAGLVLLAFIFLLYRSSRIHCMVRVPIAMAEKGKKAPVEIVVENLSHLAVSKLKFLVVAGNRRVKKKNRKWLFASDAVSGTSCFHYELVMQNPGCYDIFQKKVRIYDLTGMFYLNKKVAGFGAVQVLPEISEVGVRLSEAVRNFIGDADVYDELRSGYDNSEIFQVRPFQNGDKIQSIHWKLSAKTDEMMVRENSLPKACPLVLFLEHDRNKKNKAINEGIFLQIAGSLSFSIMDAGCPHYVCWYSEGRKDIVRIRVDDEESFYWFLTCYLEEQNSQYMISLRDAYRDKYRGEQYLYAIRIDEQLRIWKNQERVARIDPKKLQDGLSKVELIL